MESKSTPPVILVVEDDLDYQLALCDLLALEGYAAQGVGSVAAYTAREDKYDCSVLLLDRNLPDGDGLEILKNHRQHSAAPVVFITCEGSVEDRIAGMDADADYYLVKPVKPDELLAIIRRCIRKHPGTSQDYWLLDPVKWELRDPKHNSLLLTRTELMLLKSMTGKPGIAVSRDEIVKALGKSPAAYDLRRLEVAIRRLRRKVEESQLEALPLETVYGFGYVLNVDLRLNEA